MYKGLVAIDLDGTLLNGRGELSAVNRQVIRALQRNDYYITLATGRIHQSAAYYAEQLSLQGTIISHQGAVVKDMSGNKWLEYVLPPALVADLLAYSRAFPVKRGYFFNNDLVAVEQGADYLFTALTHFSRKPPLVIDELPLGNLPGAVTRMTFHGEEAALEHMYRRLQRDFGDQAGVVLMERKYLEVMHPQASKGNALRMLTEQLGLEREQVIAIGNEANDIGMLRFAGKSAAMGNAPEEVKQHADVVTKSNEEDGVAYFLQQFL